MTATREDIIGWLERAEEEDARWVIIAVDTWDYENYPIYVREDEDFWSRYPTGNMQRVDEVYDMQMDMEAQLRERRANHPPVKTS